MSSNTDLLHQMQDAIGHIDSLYPPDSHYADTARIGRELMDTHVGNSMGYSNWRELSAKELFRLAWANLVKHGESSMASKYLFLSQSEVNEPKEIIESDPILYHLSQAKGEVEKQIREDPHPGYINSLNETKKKINGAIIWRKEGLEIMEEAK